MGAGISGGGGVCVFENVHERAGLLRVAAITDQLIATTGSDSKAMRQLRLWDVR